MTATAMPPGAPMKLDVPGIVNFTQLDQGVATAGATSIEALEGLRAQGFRTIVNFRLEGEPGADIAQAQARAAELGLTYVHLPFTASAPDAAMFDAFLATMADPSLQPVFVHCASANRVGGVWLAKRVLLDGWTLEAATAEARLIGLSNAALEQFALAYIAGRQAGH